MFTPVTGWTILEYEKGEDYQASSAGILAPTARAQRMHMKGTTHTIGRDPDHDLPDLIRFAVVVASTKFQPGYSVIFNKHDAYGFSVDDKYFYAIKDETIMAGLEGLSTKSAEAKAGD